MAEQKTVHLVSQEGESFDVPLDVAIKSELVRTMIDEDQDDEEAQEIPLPNVKSSILAKVIEFTQHHKTEPMNEIEKVKNYEFLCIENYRVINIFNPLFAHLTKFL